MAGAHWNADARGTHTGRGVSAGAPLVPPPWGRRRSSAAAQAARAADGRRDSGAAASTSGRRSRRGAPGAAGARRTPTRCNAAVSPNELAEAATSPQQLWTEVLLPAVDYLSNPGEKSRVRDALAVAYYAHDGQVRKSGEPFIVHPVAVAVILAQLRADADTLCAGLLHDTVEDTDAVTFASIERQFGRTVANIVEGETKMSKRADAAPDEGPPKKNGKANGAAPKKNGTPSPPADDVAAQDLREMFSAMTGELRVILVKLADRLHNMRTLEHMKAEKQKKIARETLDVYAPLARMLGVHCIKSELEDLSFRYAMPEHYRLVSERIAQLQGEQQTAAEEAMGKLETMLRNDDYMKAFREYALELRLVSRTPYSVYNALMEASAKESFDDGKKGPAGGRDAQEKSTRNGVQPVPPPTPWSVNAAAAASTAAANAAESNGVGIVTPQSIARKVSKCTSAIRGANAPRGERGVPPQYLAPSLRMMSDAELERGLDKLNAAIKLRIVLSSRDPLALALTDAALSADPAVSEAAEASRMSIDSRLRMPYLSELASIPRTWTDAESADSASPSTTMGQAMMRPGVVHPLCYHILYITHSVYAPLPGRLKDFIATPRSNGYQALHTTVLPLGTSALFPLEVQICSEEMDAFAQLGIARFNNYYERVSVFEGDGGDADAEATLANGSGASEPQSRWLANLYRLFQRCQREIDSSSTAREFVDILTNDLLARSVFVYDARDGGLVHLPRGATCADFAYFVDSRALGDWMVGAKVNGATTDGTVPLENGDMVEIVTYRPRTANEQVASLPPVSARLLEERRLWLAACKTHQARAGLSEFFDKHGGLPKEAAPGSFREAGSPRTAVAPAGNGDATLVPSRETLELIVRSSVARNQKPTCRLVVRCLDKDGLLADVARTIADRGIGVITYSGAPMTLNQPGGPRWFEMKYEMALPSSDDAVDDNAVARWVEILEELAQALDALHFIAWFKFERVQDAL